MPALSTNSMTSGFEAQSGLQIGRILVEANGSVCSIKGNRDRVVKIVCSYSKGESNKMMRLLKALKKIKSPAVVRIHQFGTFKADGQECYYYVMDRLQSMGGAYIDKGQRIAGYLYGDPLPSKGLNRIRSFVKKVRALDKHYHHHDVHGGNIMRTKRGALKFVDLESFNY